MNNVIHYKKYEAEISYSGEDQIFFGKLIGIKDLVIFEADSVKGLKIAFAEAVKDYIDFCKEIKKTPEKTYKGSFNVRIPSELHRQAAIFASLKKVSLNHFVRYALDETISKETGIVKAKKKVLA